MINKKSRIEQVFILVIFCIGVFGVFMLTGCSGQSCETIQYGSVDYQGGCIKSISIPGCGGCLTSGRGCNSCLWPQAYKVSCGNWQEPSTYNGNEKQDKFNVVGCDTRYYGDGCLGCGQREKTCYGGYMNIDASDDQMRGIFYGSSDNDEKMIGCGGCISSKGIGAYALGEMETVE